MLPYSDDLVDQKDYTWADSMYYWEYFKELLIISDLRI